MSLASRLVRGALRLFVFLLWVNVSVAAILPQDDSLKAAYLEVLESGVDFFEPIFTESLTDAPEAGFYDIRQYGNWTHPRNETYHTLCIIPANGQVVLTYAVLLKYSKKTSFGESNISREVLFEHLRKAIRWICLTSAYVEQPYDFLPEVRPDLAKGRQWHRKWGLRQDLIGYLSLGVALLWDDLDLETRMLFKQVATGTAVRGRVPRTATVDGNGNHDQVKQDLSSTVAAAYLFEDHPEYEQFWQFVEGAGLDMVSTKKDFTSNIELQAGRLKDLALSTNLHSDFSSFHHNHPSIWYGIDLIFEGRSYVELMSAVTGHSVPETYNYAGNGFDGVYNFAVLLSTNNGVISHLRTPEYDSSYGAGLLAFCYGNIFKQDPGAIELEAAALNLLTRHTSAVGEYDYHRGSWAKAAMAYLWHHFSVKRSAGGEGEGGSDFNTRGTFFLEELNALIHRSSNALNSFVWGSKSKAGGGGPGAQVIPVESSGPFVYSRSDGLVGSMLMHRPLWLYAGFIGLITFFSLFFFWLKRKGSSFSSQILFLLLLAGMANFVVVGIDFFFTVPLRIPEAVVPSTVFPFLAAISSFVLLCLTSIGRGSQTIFLSKLLKLMLIALSVVPCSLLLMLRTPWVGIFKGESFVAMPITHIVIFITAIGLVSIYEKVAKHRKLLLAASFVMIFLAVGGEAEGSLYLRFVSIRNVPRVSDFMFWAAAILVSFGFVCYVIFKKVPLLIFQLLGVAVFSSVAVLSLSFGRFDLPKVGDIVFEASDNGFSTAGRSWTSHSEIKHAFFSYDDGVAILFNKVEGKKNGLATWSGVPVHFYQRGTYVAPRIIDTQAGRERLDRLDVVSSSWRVENLLSGYFVSTSGDRLEGSEQLGFNWARTEDYLDRTSVLSLAPRKRFVMKAGDLVEETAVVIFPGAEKDGVDFLSSPLSLLSGKLAKGWLGGTVKTKSDVKLIAVANLSCQKGSSQVVLGDKDWAPVFSKLGHVEGQFLRIDLTLQPYETYRDSSYLELFLVGDVRGRIKKVSDNGFSIIPDSGGVAKLVVRWQGPKVVQAVFRSNRTEKIVNVQHLSSDNGVAIEVETEGLLNLDFADNIDSTPPFVMIDEPVLSDDGWLTVNVQAHDRSGLSKVELYMDGVLYSGSKISPYTWTVPIENSGHSFWAIATDNSPSENRRKSFVKTWLKGDEL